MSASERTTGFARAHVFTNFGAAFFLKQFPGFSSVLDGIDFSFGLDVPDDIDVLILFARASYSIPTRLPKERTVFLAAEPDAIHPYSSRFLDQFGIVLSATDKPLKTERWRTAPCWPWFAGIDYSRAADGFPMESMTGIDWFQSLVFPEKEDKISVVTSNKAYTPYQQKRLVFIEELNKLIPDRLAIYGHGHRSIDDKKDALLPYRYHLAIENCEGADLWTEKLADPFLCGAFPFYTGCTNADEYFPESSFQYIDLADPKAAAELIMRMIDSGHHEKVAGPLEEARHIILTKYNAAQLLLRLAKAALAKDVPDRVARPRLIRSERSLWPENGSKGSLGQWALRNAALTLYPKAELKAASLQQMIERRRMRKRARQRIRIESVKNT